MADAQPPGRDLDFSLVIASVMLAGSIHRPVLRHTPDARGRVGAQLPSIACFAPTWPVPPTPPCARCLPHTSSRLPRSITRPRALPRAERNNAVMRGIPPGPTRYRSRGPLNRAGIGPERPGLGLCGGSLVNLATPFTPTPPCPGCPYRPDTVRARNWRTLESPPRTGGFDDETIDTGSHHRRVVRDAGAGGSLPRSRVPRCNQPGDRHYPYGIRATGSTSDFYRPAPSAKSILPALTRGFSSTNHRRTDRRREALQ